jgi:hypothetical protein
VWGEERERERESSGMAHKGKKLLACSVGKKERGMMLCVFLFFQK